TPDHVVVASAGYAHDRGLQLHPGDGALLPSLDAADVAAAQRDVIARHETPHVTPVLNVNLVEPLHVRDAVPAGHDEPDGRTMIKIERRAVHFVGDEHLRAHRVLDVHAASEVLLHVDVANFL